MIGSQIIGKSTILDNVIQKTYLASRSSDASVLLLGESGSGKDLFAKLVHFAGIRHKGPFIAVNSSVFSAGLVQSALFGHKKGAFTGASYDHKGYFEEADNGSIFLDEISEMPTDIQANILRILEQKVVKRLGDNTNRKTDFRLISASNKDMNKLLKQNKFRFDLFNRINTIEIHIPPLRERQEDIPLLIEYFINTISERLQKERPQISQSAINMLCDYDYPGNVRELKNIIERLILFCKNNKINKEDVYSLQAVQTKTVSAESIKNLNLAENERELISEAMRRTDNVQVKAATLLGISTYTLNRRLKKFLVEK
jgi:transcriptional regulator with PAS, ATPase and Fis domain